MSQQLTIRDLNEILSVLKDFRNDRWEEFGLEAGLYKPTLDNIDKSSGVKTCFRECLSAWLTVADNVKEKGVPTWLRLADIVEELGDGATADNIRSNKDKPIEEQEVSISSTTTSTTTDQNFYLPRKLGEYYLRMSAQFATILTRFVNEVFKEENTLKDLKITLVGIRPSNKREVEEVDTETGLMCLLRSYFSMWNFQALITLVRSMEMELIAKELDQLEKNHKKLYKTILAASFARSAIKHCGEMNSKEITFEVLWPIDRTTLSDFEKFLTDVFCSQNMLIHLKSIHRSLLMFICSIPYWLVEEMKAYVKKEKDLIISKGVVEVTVDGTIIFNVKQSLEQSIPSEDEEKEKDLFQMEDAEEELVVQQTAEGRSIEYASLIFYEEECIMSFIAVPCKRLNALLEYIKDHHQFAEIGQIHYFCFKSSHGFIELKFDEKPPTGWTIIPFIKPCRLYQVDIDKYDGTDDSIPPSCLVSVYGSPGAVPSLHYAVPVVGVTDPVTLYIHRLLNSTISPEIGRPYTGLVYYERKENKNVVVFTASKDLHNLVKHIEEHHPLAKINQLINFDFNSSQDYIELDFSAIQEQPFTGWTIEPQSCKLYQDEMSTFNAVSSDHPLPPSCLVSVYGSPNAVPLLHYAVPLVGVADPVTLYIESTLKPTATLSQDDMSYTGLVYYEWKGKEYFMTFTAAKKLSKLLEFIEEYHPLAEVDQIFNFTFSSPHGFIELIFDHSEDDDSCKGWTLQPLVRPCRLYQEDIYNFSEANYPLPPSCLVSVYGSPNALPSLHYSVPLVGVADPFNIVVNRKLQLEKKYLDFFDTFHSLQFENESLKEERHKKDVEITASMKKIRNYSEENEKLKAKVADNEKYITELLEEKTQAEEQKQLVTEEYEKLKAKVTELLEEKTQAEEQYLEEKQMITELKAKVSDNELHIAKLIKEKTQLQERNTSQQEQSIKETSNIGLQFNYLVHSMDNLECLSDVQVAEKKLILVQGDKPQLMNWERFGLRIGVEEDSLSSSETREAAVVALVGGEFMFPENTVLVSAVYAVTVSEPLLKPMRLEIQHCVNLSGQPDLSKYLKFAIAPMSTPSLPYQFRIIEGGEFSSDSRYGSINHNNSLCLVCILGDLSGSIMTYMTYAGALSYEEKGAEDLVTFSTTKYLNVLIEFIRQDHPHARMGQNIYFYFQSSKDYIELNFDSPQIAPFTGWSIEPHTKPCRLFRSDVDNFGGANYSLPPSCLVSVYGSPGAVPSLHYAVPLVGVADPVTLYIHRSLRITPPSTNPSTSYSTAVPEATAASSTGGASNVDKVKKVINDVLVSHHASLTSLPKKVLPDLANQLYIVHLIGSAINEAPSMEECIAEFKASLSFQRKLPQIQEHCRKFLNSFIAVRGSYAYAAIALHEDWNEAITELGLDFNINIDS